MKYSIGKLRIKLKINLLQRVELSFSRLRVSYSVSFASTCSPLYPTLAIASINVFAVETFSSKRMDAFSAEKFTVACFTPGTFFNCLSMIFAHEEQCIPKSDRLTRLFGSADFAAATDCTGFGVTESICGAPTTIASFTPPFFLSAPTTTSNK